MRKLIQFVHKIFFVLFVQAKNYSDESKSKEIASLIFSIYLTINILIVLFIIDIVTNAVFQDKDVTKYILMGVAVFSYIISLVYFSFKKRYLNIHNDISKTVADKKLMIRMFVIFNVVIFIVLVLISVLNSLS